LHNLPGQPLKEQNDAKDALHFSYEGVETLAVMTANAGAHRR
jgi:hypothetical protein